MLEKVIEGHIEETIYDMAPAGEQRKLPHLKMNPLGERAIVSSGCMPPQHWIARASESKGS